MAPSPRGHCFSGYSAKRARRSVPLIPAALSGTAIPKRTSARPLRSCLQVSRPHQERGEGDSRLAGLGGLVVAGRDATPLLEADEAPFHDVALLVKLLVEAGRASASAAAAGPVALLVGPLGNGVGDAAPPQPGGYRARAVALVAQHMSGPQPGPSRPEAGHPNRLHHGGELRAVVRVAARQHEAERAPQGIAGQMDLAGQTAPGASECGDAEPSFLDPTACW